jgi:hypothetical protein
MVSVKTWCPAAAQKYVVDMVSVTATTQCSTSGVRAGWGEVLQKNRLQQVLHFVFPPLRPSPPPQQAYNNRPKPTVIVKWQ